MQSSGKVQVNTVGRFAPSPSGRLHLGNIWCALAAYLSAKSKGGSFVVRIEDLDTLRSPAGAADQILRDLEGFGLYWQGEVLYQSRRSEVYAHYLGVLEQKGLTYPCFCSRAALHADLAPHAADGNYIYSGMCKALSAAESTKKAAVRAPAVRLAVPDQPIEFFDGCCGRQSQNLKTECGDFIVRRSDGVFAYQLAVVVDDALSGVTEVVRGADLLPSAARQIWLHGVLGFTPPAFCHVPLLLDEAGRRLAKRDGDGIGEWLARLTPAEIIGRLAFYAGLTESYAPALPDELVGRYDEKKLKGSIQIKPI